MRIHKEGYKTIIISTLAITATCLVLWYALGAVALYIALGIGALKLAFIMRFFRMPWRILPCNNNNVYSPCDGKIVAIEEVVEDEFLKTSCIQVSIFMSVWNVHINWYPIAGRVIYSKYHPGKFLVAWHPKSSTLNERTTVVVERADGGKVLMRQIAGLIARRIVCYAKVGMQVGQCKQVGFIKFGSRVDLYLPIDSKIAVSIGERVVGTQTIIAGLPLREQ